MIVFIVESYFSERDYLRFGIDILKSRGETVSVWDVSQLSQKEKRSISSFDQHIIIQSKAHLKKLTQNLKNVDFVFPVLALDFRNLYIWRNISQKTCKLVYMQLVGIPKLEFKKKGGRLFNFFKNSLNEPLYFLDMLVYRMARKYFAVRDYDLYLLAGEKSKQPSFSEDKIIWATSLDYRLFKENPDLGERNHIVFLDEYEPFHPDFKKYSIKTISPEPYYDELNEFFSFLEKKYELPVVVAAHPHVENLDLYKKYFNNRKVVSGQTVKLIRDSWAVVAHTSTAMQIAMLYERPIVIITTNQMNETYKKDHFPSYEIPYGFKLLNISDEKNFSFFDFEENVEGREKYLKDYTISSKAQAKVAWQIFCDEINTLK